MTDPTLLVLTSLADGDKHGYAIMIDIEDFSGVRLSPGTLYGAITRLRERGWIDPMEPNDRRHPFRISATGREHLEKQVAGLGRVVYTATLRLRAAKP